MDEVDIMCELALMYVVVCGMESLLESSDKESRKVSSLEFNAVGTGVSWMRGEFEQLWAVVREQV